MLSATNLTIAVAGRTLVAHLDLALAPGQCWAVLGPNGAGKTSLLHALAGLREAQAGEIRLDGVAIARRPRREVARRVGVLLQDETESFWGSVLEYVMLGRMPHDIALLGADRAGEAAAHAALDDVDLAAHASQPYRTLSGGERQRARLAQLIVQAPEVWLLDEPLAHLDLGHQVAVMRLVSKLTAAGRAVAMALHEPLWAARTGDRALLLYDSGRFRLGPTHAVLTQENLEALYGCRLEPAASAAVPVFVPAAT